MLDLLIKNAKIIDGSGSDEYFGSVGVVDGKICKADGTEEAKQVIDADGLYLTPGFIDSHSHGDQVLGRVSRYACKNQSGHNNRNRRTVRRLHVSCNTGAYRP